MIFYEAESFVEGLDLVKTRWLNVNSIRSIEEYFYEIDGDTFRGSLIEFGPEPESSMFSRLPPETLIEEIEACAARGPSQPATVMGES